MSNYTFETIEEVLKNRDGMTDHEAEGLINEAQSCFYDYLANGDIENAMEVCEDFFGLEPDYLDAFLCI